jgi:hypothetical protein
MNRLFGYLQAREVGKPPTGFPGQAKAIPTDEMASQKADSRQFQVCAQLFDSSAFAVAGRTDAATASHTVRRLLRSIDACVGRIERIWILDAGDRTAFEWHWRKGVLLPLEEERR